MVNSWREEEWRKTVVRKKRNKQQSARQSKGRMWKGIRRALLVGLLGILLPALGAEAGKINDSPYTEMAPDGRAWTTCPGEKHNYYYEEGYTVDTGVESALRALTVGEHYYDYERIGDIPVGEWKVEWPRAFCIHGDQWKQGYHGLSFRKQPCETEYTQGWYAYCADCGEPLERLLVYMCEAAAKSISVISTGMDYYYLCPHCTHLEQGSEFKAHSCHRISANQYKIAYQANISSEHTFSMAPMSLHMYNNATVYEGETVTPITRLAKMNIEAPGYEFVGWNTLPDGSGIWYADEQEICNLTEYDWRQDARGTIILYAQWKPSKSTLQIDPAGGTYLGNGGITSYTGSYMDSQMLYPEGVKAPDKAVLYFRANGGNAVAAMPVTQQFSHWETTSNFGGRLEENIYHFLGKNGTVDKVTAVYTPDRVILPMTEKENASFGGWYYDEACTRPAGAPGDAIVVERDTTLYAGWVELKLNSSENYTSGDRKGAVDLSWNQPDHYLKAYRVYKGETPENWSLINSTGDEGVTLNVSESLHYSGAAKAYEIPYTGLYQLTAAGAQGGNYGSYRGGLGGEAKGSFWLKAGDVITYTIGGQSGYNGGGIGSTYGNGGGATVISSAEHGVLLVAAGGGGATSTEDGKQGGGTASANLTGTGYEGEGGAAGGGGGYRGGKAGFFHQHTAACYSSGTVTAGKAFYSTAKATEKSGWLSMEANYPAADTSNAASFYAYSAEEDCKATLTVGDAMSYFATPGEGILTFQVEVSDWGIDQVTFGKRVLTVYSNNGESLLSADLSALPGTTTIEEKCECYNSRPECDCEDCDCDTGWRWPWYIKEITHENISGAIYYRNFNGRGGNAVWCTRDVRVNGKGTKYLTVTLPISTDTDGIYVKLDYAIPGESADSGSCIGVNLMNFTYTYSYISCGQSEVSTPAYGGSSYINTALSSNYNYHHGSNEGNGYFTIQSESIGFVSELKMDGVAAPDREAPDKVDASRMQVEPVSGSGGSKVSVSWENPSDKGTDYYFKVESYRALDGAKLCTSNIRKNTLITGVKGYCYILNAAEKSTVTAANATYTVARSLQIPLTEQIQYLHIAAIDVAGNVSATTSICIGSTSGTDIPSEVMITWPVFTGPIDVSLNAGVYPVAGTDTYYVRCDNETVLELQFDAYMEGTATRDYQINQCIIETQTEAGNVGRNIVGTPLHEIGVSEIVTEGSGLSMVTEGASMLIPYPHMRTIRSNNNKDIREVCQYVIGEDADGKRIRVTPSAGVVTDKYGVYSDKIRDLEHSIYLIGDRTAPVVWGTDTLESETLIYRGETEMVLQLRAEDSGSGLKEFWVEILNEDNGGFACFEAGADGTIHLDLTMQNALVAGDFMVTIIAEDNVGNICREVYHVTELALEAEVSRILAPHTPVFKRGESGYLSVETWGHVAKVEVEFPGQLSDYNRAYEYGKVRYKTEDTIQFMIPLYGMADGGYDITVRVYKDDARLGCVKQIHVSRTILDELRTRLR